MNTGADPTHRNVLEWLLPGCQEDPDSDAIFGRMHVFPDGVHDPERDHLKGSIKPAGPNACGAFCGGGVQNVTVTLQGMIVPTVAAGIPTRLDGPFVVPLVTNEPGTPCSDGCCFSYHTGACNWPCPNCNPFQNPPLQPFGCFYTPITTEGCNYSQHYTLPFCAFSTAILVSIRPFVDVGGEARVGIGLDVWTTTLVDWFPLNPDCGLGTIGYFWFANPAFFSRTVPQFEQEFCSGGVVIQNDLTLQPNGTAVGASRIIGGVGHSGFALLQAGP